MDFFLLFRSFWADLAIGIGSGAVDPTLDSRSFQRSMNVCRVEWLFSALAELGTEKENQADQITASTG